MKIYTRTGDTGETGLRGGQRVSKCDPRIQAIGEVDELNAAIGVVRAVGPSATIDGVLMEVQSCLFDLGAELARTSEDQGDGVREADAAYLETSIDAMTAELAPLTQFILPGGCELAARLHMARAVCRRAERAVLELNAAGLAVSGESRAYLNRLSDWLFVAARLANAELGQADVPWRRTR